MNEQKHFQELFFNYLIKRRSGDMIMNETMEVLNLRKGAVYKRMNGDTALTTAELIKLSQHFNISLDTALDNKAFISFQHPFMLLPSKMNFLDALSVYLKPLMKTDESKLTYLANELPVFYYFSHEYIFNFLLSIWNHLHWDSERLVIAKHAHVDQQLQKLRGDITNYYNAHPVTEIWNSNMFANLYQQIIFSITIRAFAELTFIENLIRDIEKLINHLRDLAFTGVKKNVRTDIELKIYLNEFGNYLNMVLYESTKFSATFVGFDIPHFLVTHNKQFSDYSKDWVNKIRKRSVLISSEGYQYRELFFIKMEKDFKQFKENAEKLIGIYYA